MSYDSNILYLEAWLLIQKCHQVTRQFLQCETYDWLMYDLEYDVQDSEIKSEKDIIENAETDTFNKESINYWVDENTNHTF